MLKEAIEYLQTISIPEKYTIDGRTYTSHRLQRLPDKITPDSLVVHTLTGLCDYIKSGFDQEYDQNVIVHVEDPTTVSLTSELYGEDYHQRAIIVEANAKPILEQSFQFGRFMSIPEFIIGLQSGFDHTEDKDTILQIVSNIKADQSQEYLDTGYSQEVAAKRGTGSTLAQSVKIPNPVSLKPYRTFLEIEQPESSFVFRLSSGNEGQQPLCGLFEASGGAWKLDAIQKIRAYLLVQDLGMDIIA